MSEDKQASSAVPPISVEEDCHDPAPEAASQYTHGESRVKSSSRLSYRRPGRKDPGATTSAQPVVTGTSQSQRPPDEAKRGQAPKISVKSSPPTPSSQEVSFHKKHTAPVADHHKRPELKETQNTTTSTELGASSANAVQPLARLEEKPQNAFSAHSTGSALPDPQALTTAMKQDASAKTGTSKGPDGSASKATIPFAPHRRQVKSEAEQASRILSSTSHEERREDFASEVASQNATGESRSRIKTASKLSQRRPRRKERGSTTSSTQPMAAGASSTQQPPPDEAKRGQAPMVSVENSPPMSCSQEAFFYQQQTTTLVDSHKRPVEGPQHVFSSYSTAASSPLLGRQALTTAVKQDGSAKAGSSKGPDECASKVATPTSPFTPQAGRASSGAATSLTSGNASPMVHSFWSMFSSHEYHLDFRDHQSEYLLCMVCGMVAAALILLSFFVAAQVMAKPNYIEVHGPFGTVRGFGVSVEGRPVHVFIGIPYAAAPVGPLRFARPSPPNHVAITNVVGKRNMACPQPHLGNTALGTSWIFDEDCLRLNIWMPASCALEPSCGENKTVLVFIAGNLFQQRDAGDVTRDGSILAALGDVAVVTFAYRLGALGFLCASGERDCGNMGLYDQTAAIEWVRNNIAYFGGNHSKIVVAGHGSGAASIGIHMLHPNSEWTHYVNRFIVMSDSPYKRQSDSRADAINKAADLSRELGCADPADDAASATTCLQSAELSALLEASSATRERFAMLFLPTHGTDMIPVRPSVLSDVASVKGKEVLIGHTTSEGAYQVALFRSMLTGSLIEEPLEKHAVSVLRWMCVPNAEQVVAAYVNATSQLDMAAIQSVFGDALSACPVHYFTENLALDGANAVYAYVINHTLLYERWLIEKGDDDDDEHVAHFGGLEYLFGLPLRSEHPATEEEEGYSRNLIDIWANFSKYGQLPTVQGEAWPAFDLQRQATVELSWPERAASQNAWRTKCDALRKHLL